VPYREHPSPRELEPWLVCTWERVGDGPPVRVLPDGCIDVIYHRGVGSAIVGPNTTAFVVPVASQSYMLGARMRPGAAPVLLGVAAESLRDERVGLELALGIESARLEEEIDRDRHRDPVRALERWLARHAADAQLPDPLVGAAVGRLSGCADDVNGLARELGVSGRGLRRRMTAAVGYGPKRLGRVLRLRRALAAAQAGDELGRVAFDAGYADQAHFSGDCRELAGVPPSLLISQP
jgi:AraC-like DNA-binding protein